MHVAAFVATIGVFLGIVGPWVTLGRLGSRSGIYYSHGIVMLIFVGVMALGTFYSMALRWMKKPVPASLVFSYLLMGVAIAGYSMWVKGTIEFEVADIAAKFKLSQDTLIGWGITSLPFTGGAVALAGIAAFFMPGEVGGEAETQERRRLG
ncbi:hypothetical protein KKF84_14300 [Myxococcota bacterium]|nr:hypothetical protein [Myxococcota bacterium]MBU1536493.1 hypothetical protein [Myxococcota bacterium]